MIEFTKYDTYTKEIVAVGSCPNADIGYQAQVSEGIVIGTYPPKKYYIEGSLPRVKSGYLLSISKFIITADGVDTSVISNIPSNTTITINSSSFEVNDGVFALTSSEIATLILTFTNNYYLISTVTINAI